MDVVADFRRPRSGWPARPAIDLTEDPAILTAIANDIGVEAIFARQVIAYGRAGDVLLALSTSGNSANVIAALGRGAPARPARRSRWSATTAGGSPPRGWPTTSSSRRSEHIPRIQEAQASAYHVLRELVERRRPAVAVSVTTRRRVRAARRGDGAGRRLPPLRLPAGGRARARRLRAATTRAACCSRSRATPTAVERFLGAAARRGAAAGRGRARVGRGPDADRRARLRDRREPARRRAGAPVSARHGDLRRLPARAARSGRPPLPLPVHQLHQLRPAVHDRPRRPVRPAADDDGRVRDVRRAARPSTTTPRDRRFHAQPNACPDCGPSLRLLGPTAARAPARRTRWPRRVEALLAGRIVAVKGDRRVPPRLPRRRRGAVAELRAASIARTSRSR